MLNEYRIQKRWFLIFIAITIGIAIARIPFFNLSEPIVSLLTIVQYFFLGIIFAPILGIWEKRPKE